METFVAQAERLLKTAGYLVIDSRRVKKLKMGHKSTKAPQILVLGDGVDISSQPFRQMVTFRVHTPRQEGMEYHYRAVLDLIEDMVGWNETICRGAGSTRETLEEMYVTDISVDGNC